MVFLRPFGCSPAYSTAFEIQPINWTSRFSRWVSTMLVSNVLPSPMLGTHFCGTAASQVRFDWQFGMLTALGRQQPNRRLALQIAHSLTHCFLLQLGTIQKAGQGLRSAMEPSGCFEALHAQLFEMAQQKLENLWIDKFDRHLQHLAVSFKMNLETILAKSLNCKPSERVTFGPFFDIPFTLWNFWYTFWPTATSYFRHNHATSIYAVPLQSWTRLGPAGGSCSNKCICHAPCIHSSY